MKSLEESTNGTTGEVASINARVAIDKNRLFEASKNAGTVRLETGYWYPKEAVPEGPIASQFEAELKGSIGEGPNHSNHLNHSNHSNSFKIQDFFLEN